MKMIDIGYHHKYDTSFVNDRPDGTDLYYTAVQTNHRQNAGTV